MLYVTQCRDRVIARLGGQATAVQRCVEQELTGMDAIGSVAAKIMVIATT